ncbi:hypothetical protein DY000_02022168 [Brassica cretica]|uniref:Pentatricopeptide repeat-containing protein n=1 Tax=Brassica cretica TaxID=69181 RepID=A0ABQ7E968_BRACR|nr:hypothetical protein DY000_02022168 [Brassica cretica]
MDHIILVCGKWKFERKKWLFEVDNDQGSKLLAANEETRYEDFVKIIYEDYEVDFAEHELELEELSTAAVTEDLSTGAATEELTTEEFLSYVDVIVRERPVKTKQHAKGILARNSRALFFCYNGNVTPSSTFPWPNYIRKQRSVRYLSTSNNKGTKLNPSLVRGIFEKLRDSKRFPQALEILKEAEKFLESIPKNLREAAFKKMRELGFLLKPAPYSSTTSLYSSVGNRGKVDEILREMKENNVKLDSFTVNNVLRVYAAESEVRSMEKLLAGCEAITMLQVRTALDMAKAYLRVGSKM